MRAAARWLLAFALPCACGLGTTPAAQLKESVEDYVRSIRWGHIERAANYVPEALRAQFIRQKRLAQTQVTIHEYDVRAVEYVQGAPRARVIIAAVWSRPADPVTHQQLLAQEWRLAGRGWEMARQQEVQQLPAHLDVVHPGDAL
ncbi:MAG: hypothetical protein FJ100_04800 [Deltaproteobacteria bacterium]|nr:hypothetical protein [Deltaproteobacteria bacterium]